ncbi:MAG TPA: hypothetical protein VF020_15610 [Chthoniobacterales bacterium]
MFEQIGLVLGLVLVLDFMALLCRARAMKAKRFSRDSEPLGEKSAFEHEDDNEHQYDYRN